MSELNVERSKNTIITLPQEIDLDTLLESLVAAKIPVEEYGQGNAKTILHLLSEVNGGESTLTIDQNGEIHRTVNVLWVDVFCALTNGEIYKLKEDRQEFKDGRIKRRTIDSSIGEKIKPSEKAEDAVMRALHEELGISSIDALYESGYEERTSYSSSFPGIENTFKMHKFTTIVPESAFLTDGYIEEQEDKTNYYTWEAVIDLRSGVK